MSDVILRTAVRVKVEAHSLPQTLARATRRAGERLRREQTGAEVLEYGGILVLVGLIIVVLFQFNIPNTVSTKVGTAISQIFNTGGTGGGGTGTTAAGGH
jgi:Flp pilus assembly pilin Flp